MKPDAPLLHDDLFTQGVEPKPTHASNIAKVVAFSKGDIDAGFRAADVPICASDADLAKIVKPRRLPGCFEDAAK